MSNKTFTHGNPSWANACVGKNGIINYITYAEGFSKAANLILKHILNNKGLIPPDDYIYPICFNMRHSVELRLKGSIDELSTLAKIQKKTLPQFNLTSSHDIGNIWDYYKQHSESLDIRFAKINASMEQTILDIARIDSTGQTFRYPYNSDTNQHLTEQSTINIYTLYCKFSELEKNLQELYSLINELIIEYGLFTFTTRLSRPQIFQLAKDLPPREKWREDLNKEALKLKYCLSGRELSTILDKIQDNYETCSFIGIQKSLMALDNNLIIKICDFWVTIHPDYKEDLNTIETLIPYNIGEFIEEISRMEKAVVDFYKTIKNHFREEHIADLMSLFYFGRQGSQYSEEYLHLYTEYEKALSPSNIENNLIHMLSNNYFLQYLVEGLTKLKQIDLIEKLTKLYEL